MSEMIYREEAIEEINKQIQKYSGNWLQDILTRNGLIIAREILITLSSVNDNRHIIDADDLIEDFKQDYLHLTLDGLKGTPRSPCLTIETVVDRIKDFPSAE